MDQLSPELEELLHCSFRLRKMLEQVLPPEAVLYIMTLIARDGAHRKFLQITEENENDKSGTEEAAAGEQSELSDKQGPCSEHAIDQQGEASTS